MDAPGQRMVSKSVDSEARDEFENDSLYACDPVFSIFARVDKTTFHVDTGWPAASRVELAD
jgi:hypothetical protein